MEDEMEKGLNRTTASEADLKMLPTYVCQLPTGKEINDILALDLGGSNFRVLLIKLRENEPPKILNKVFIVSESIMKGSGDKVHIIHYHINTHFNLTKFISSRILAVQSHSTLFVSVYEKP